MASVAIKFNESKKRWEGLVNGRIKSHSTHLDYVQNKMTALGYRVSAEQDLKEDAKKVDEFGITKRFEFVKQMVSMVAKKTVASAIITGQGGLGKTHSVIKALKDCGLQDVTDLASFEVGTRLQGSKSFRIIKGFSTAKGLYRSLFEGNGMTLVFDDTDNILKDPVALNLLKGALDSYGERYINWNADIKDEDLPRSFKFTGSVVFISNKDMESLDQAVRSRALCVDLSMSEEQKIERMETIVDDAEFLPEYSKEYKHDALEFLRSMVKSVQNLSLRSLISVVKIRAEGGDWKQLAKYILTAGT